VHPPGAPDSLKQPSSLSVIAVIPARFDSTRLPGKILADIDGHPMVEHVYRRASAAESVSRVLVATDDQRIGKAVEAFGGEFRMTSRSHQSGTDRITEIAGDLSCDLVVNVQGDLPLVEPAMIDEAVAPFANDPALQISTLRRRIVDAAERESPHVVKVVVDRDGFALYFSRSPIPFPGGAGSTYKHIGLYVYRRDFLATWRQLEPTPLERAERLEQLRALEHGFRIKAVETVHESIEVDTEDDLERVRRLITAGARG
jgi:3-deoxy-manno-octulosonate cytidylyltransferase (CMP-KDO synthetase)